MSVESNIETQGIIKEIRTQELSVSGNVAISGNLQLGEIILDVDSDLILSSSVGSVTLSGNLDVLGNLSQNGLPVGGSAGVLSSSTGAIVSSGSIEFSETNKSYHIRTVNSGLIFSSSNGNVVISGNLRVLGTISETASTENFRHVSGSSNLTLWHIANSNHDANNTTAAVALDRLYAIPFIAPTRGGTIGDIAIDVTVASATPTTGVFAVWENVGDTNIFPGSLFYSSSFFSTAGSAGLRQATVNKALSPGKLYWFGILISGSSAPTLRSVPVANCSSLLGTNFEARVANVYGTHIVYVNYFPTTPLYLSASFPTSATVSRSTSAPPAIAVFFTA